MSDQPPQSYDMELVGTLESYWQDENCFWMTFRCTNKEVFDLRFPPALKRIPQDTLVRVWSKRVPGEEGARTREQVCLHWEML